MQGFFVRGVGGVLVSAWMLQAGNQPAIAVTADARSLQPGELVVLTITAPEPLAAVRASAFQRTLAPFRVDDRTWRALVGIDLTVPAGTYTVTLSATTANRAELKATHRLRVAAKSFPTRTLTVDNAFVTPPESAAARIAEDARDLARCWTSSSAEKLWQGGFVRPVPHEANSAFGSRSVFNGQPRNPHTGADFRSPAGTPIKAPNAGRVLLARDLYYSGGTVVIDHGLEVFSLFAHLSSIDVEVASTVAAGQVVGKVGATGRVTGAHLHWMVRVGGARIDPLSLIHVMGQ